VVVPIQLLRSDPAGSGGFPIALAAASSLSMWVSHEMDYPAVERQGIEVHRRLRVVRKSDHCPAISFVDEHHTHSGELAGLECIRSKVS
jgi:hypothetical protein